MSEGTPSYATSRGHCRARSRANQSACFFILLRALRQKLVQESRNLEVGIDPNSVESRCDSAAFVAEGTGPFGELPAPWQQPTQHLKVQRLTTQCIPYQTRGIYTIQQHLQQDLSLSCIPFVQLLRREWCDHTQPSLRLCANFSATARSTAAPQNIRIRNSDLSD